MNTRQSSYMIALILCFLLSACSRQDQIKSDLQAMSERLESFTGLKIEAHEENYRLIAPEKHTLEQSIMPMQIAFREFYAIDDCPLGKFIAERNTALGKTQLPSTRFIYEKGLLTTLEACKQQLSTNSLTQQQVAPMLEKLEQWITQKQSNLPMVWANMLTQSDESYLAFTTAGDFISGESEDGLQATKLALNYLTASLESDVIDAKTLELHLRDLQTSRLPARMWRTQELFEQSLPPISDMLRRYIATNKENCGLAKQKEELKIMRNIFTLFFAERIQALASQLNHYQYQLNDSFVALSTHQNLPLEWQRYIKSQYVDSAQQYKAEMKTHIELWQDIFKLCE